MPSTALLAAVPGYTTLDAATARARLERGEFAALIDVRTEAEWDDGHLPNATFAPSLPSFFAEQNPMPEAPPVTIATWPENRVMAGEPQWGDVVTSLCLDRAADYCRSFPLLPTN